MPLQHVLEIGTTLLTTYSTSEYLYGAKLRARIAMAIVVGLQFVRFVSSWWGSLPAATASVSLFGLTAFAGPLKVAIVAASFLGALYIDCKRGSGDSSCINPSLFAREIAKEFLLLLPVCPWLSVLISFVFFLIISIFDIVGLPTSILNGPIYYGTLYGPFAVIYVRIKRTMSRIPLLPSSSSSSQSSFGASSGFTGRSTPTSLSPAMSAESAARIKWGGGYNQSKPLPNPWATQ